MDKEFYCEECSKFKPIEEFVYIDNDCSMCLECYENEEQNESK